MDISKVQLKVFDKEVKNWDKSYITSFSEPIEDLNIHISTVEEISIHYNEISFIYYGYEHTPSNITPNSSLFVMYFDIQNEDMNNGGDNSSEATLTKLIKWDELKHFYTKYCGNESTFINALDTNDLETAKKINKEFPDIKPSISNSFYARWLVKTGDLNFLKWAKEVDDSIDFSSKSRFENPLKIAIGYNREDIAIWLIDNYPVNLFDKYEPLTLIKQAKKMNMNALVTRMAQDNTMLEKIIDSNLTDLIPENIKDVFIF